MPLSSSIFSRVSRIFYWVRHHFFVVVGVDVGAGVDEGVDVDLAGGAFDDVCEIKVRNNYRGGRRIDVDLAEDHRLVRRGPGPHAVRDGDRHRPER